MCWSVLECTSRTESEKNPVAFLGKQQQASQDIEFIHVASFCNALILDLHHIIFYVYPVLPEYDTWPLESLIRSEHMILSYIRTRTHKDN
jgi:hypothetical protein